MSALSTRLTRGAAAATASTARFTTPITSSHSPSMLVNIALVSLGSPDARTTRIASATASPTLSSPPNGLTLKATITRPMFARRGTSGLLLAETRRAHDQDHPIRLVGRRLGKGTAVAVVELQIEGPG